MLIVIEDWFSKYDYITCGNPRCGRPPSAPVRKGCRRCDLCRQDFHQSSSWRRTCPACRRGKTKYNPKSRTMRLKALRMKLGCSNPGCRWNSAGQDFYQLIDFHHKDPAYKSFTISGGIAGKTLKELAVEVRKCITLCANCHRMVHAGLLDVLQIPACKVDDELVPIGED